MTTATYQLSTFNGLMQHSDEAVSLFRDQAGAVVYDDDHLVAQVRSGDYFVTLATELDSLARQVDDTAVRATIEDMVSDLIYLQDNYIIAKDETYSA